MHTIAETIVVILRQVADKANLIDIDSAGNVVYVLWLAVMQPPTEVAVYAYQALLSPAPLKKKERPGRPGYEVG